MHTITVGKPYAPSVGRWPEACEYLYTSNGHELRVFLSAPSKLEVAAFKKGNVDLGVFADEEVVLLLYRIGNACKWSNSAFDWFRVPEVYRCEPNLLDVPSELRIVLTDANNGIVRVVRTVTLSPDFSKALLGAIARQIEVGTTWLASKLDMLASRYQQPAHMVEDATMIQLAKP